VRRISFSLVELAEEACFYSKRVQGVKRSVIFLTADYADGTDEEFLRWSL